MLCIKCDCPVLDSEWVGEWVSYSRVCLGQATFSLCPGLWLGDFICKVGQSDWLLLLSLLDFVETQAPSFSALKLSSPGQNPQHTLNSSFFIVRLAFQIPGVVEDHLSESTWDDRWRQDPFSSIPMVPQRCALRQVVGD